MSDDVAGRMRGLADAPWVARGDAATQAALREGAAEVERLTRALDAAEAQARGAQYREREALATVAMLRAALDAARAPGDAGDLAGLGARAAGGVTGRQWRQCATCGRRFHLRDDEAVPTHEGCVVVTMGEGEGR